MNEVTLQLAFGVPFRSAKDNWKGPCPFHHEVTPSFFVHKEEYVAHCFGCGVSGPIDKLLADDRGIGVKEARTILGIEEGHAVLSKLRRSRSEASQRCAVTTFPESWLAPFKKEAHKYVLSRGLTPATLMASGSAYDATLKRQVFPHRDREGRLLGVAGRSCKEPAEYPKWLFYWEYSKGRALYRVPNMPGGPSVVRQGSRVPEGPLLIVEGIFDALWLYQHGQTNVAALLGSKPSKWQLQELREHGGPYILGLDNDLAGQEGSDILQKRLRKSGAVYHTPWPDNVNDWMEVDDPEELISRRETSVGRALRKQSRPANRETDSNAAQEESEIRPVGTKAVPE